jgi:general stress protein YciG
MANNDSLTDSSTETAKTQETTRPAGTPRKRGFGSMDPAAVRDLARKGGVAAHRAGTAHEFSSEEARAAGRKGGLAAHAGRRTPVMPAPAGKPS